MSAQDPESDQQFPVITQLEGFPDPVRDPDTGMIVPQSRRERRALEEAQQHYELKRQNRSDQSVSTIPMWDDETEDLDFGSDPSADLDHDEPAALNIENIDDQQYQTPQPVAVEPPAPKPSKAGRNLPAAITVGLVLLGAVAVGVFWHSGILAILIGILVPLGIWELSRVTKTRDIHLSLTPALVAGLGIPVAAWFGGIDAMVFALFGSIVLAVFWTTIGEPDKPGASLAVTLLAILWIPFFMSFGITLLQEPKGNLLLLTVVLAVVASDTLGYLVGATLGKHRMAPKISPKKSWEGFFGSLVGANAVAVLLTHYVLEESWWVGLIIGTTIMLAATAGDFAASMVKRDFGVKDMGNTLPGHGGVMDRLDSIVFAIPVGYTLFVVVLPQLLG